MAILADRLVSPLVAPLVLHDPSSILLFSLLIFAIALIRHTLMQYSKADTSAMNIPRDICAEQEVKESRPKFKQGGKWHLTMNLRKPNMGRWLEADDQYLLEHDIRSKLLDDKKSAVLQCLPGSEAACTEALELVVQDLITKFPEKYRAWPSASDVETVEIMATGEVFRARAPFCGMGPLEVAARLAAEDFNILIKGHKDEHTL